MTSTQSLFGLFLEYSIALLGASHLVSLFGTAALSNIQYKSGEPHQLSIGISVGLAQTLYPRHGPVGPHNAERAVKGVARLRVHFLVDGIKHLRAVLLVHTAQPGLKRGRLFRGETE